VQVLIYPALDSHLDTVSARDYADGYGLTTEDMRWSWRVYAPDDLDNPLVSPLRAPSLRDLPPAVIMTAEFDVLRDDGLRYADRLAQDGVRVTRHHYDGTIHGFLWMGAAVAECRQLLRDVAADLRELWAPRAVTR
jgi:acetyl esterase